MTPNASTTCFHSWNRPYPKLSLKRALGNKSKRGRGWWEVDIEKGKEEERKGMKKEKKKKGGREGKEGREKDREKKNHLTNPFWRKR